MSVDARVGERSATFGDVLASREYRFLLSANVFSWIGDYLARAAVTALIFHDTGSAALSAAAFALSYLPWLAGGPVLAALAERRAFRPVMVSCDLLRMVLIALVAVPGLPVWAMLTLLFGTALANPPFQAARSALLPQVLTGDRYVVGLSVQQSSGQAAQVIGLAAGAALAGFYPRLALVINAVTFGLSALLIWLGVGDRRPIDLTPERRHIFQETADGYRVIFHSRIMRAISLVVFATMFFGIVPEGLAAAWAGELVASRAEAGGAQALIMVANPIGFILGGLAIGRLIRPPLRRRLVPFFAVLVPLPLVPALASPPAYVIAIMAAACGFATAGMLPAANGIFVQVLPPGYRARAFGVMQSGVQLAQGIGVLVTGVLADRFALPTVVGGWSIAGVFVVLVMVVQWPPGSMIDAAVGARRNADPPPVADQARPIGTRGPADQIQAADQAQPAGTRGPADQAQPAGKAKP